MRVANIFVAATSNTLFVAASRRRRSPIFAIYCSPLITEHVTPMALRYVLLRYHYAAIVCVTRTLRHTTTNAGEPSVYAIWRVTRLRAFTPACHSSSYHHTRLSLTRPFAAPLVWRLILNYSINYDAIMPASRTNHGSSINNATITLRPPSHC